MRRTGKGSKNKEGKIRKLKVDPISHFLILPSLFLLTMRLSLCLFLSLCLSLRLFSQVIELFNPSFEDTPQDATMPQGWTGCKEGTTPDILPGFWGVYTPPSDGQTYV